MTPTTDLGLSIRLSMFELRDTGHWDIFLGPPERKRAETGGADQWVLKRRECSGFARVNQVTSASLRYPLSVFNKNSTLKGYGWWVFCHQIHPPGFASVSGKNIPPTVFCVGKSESRSEPDFKPRR